MGLIFRGFPALNVKCGLNFLPLGDIQREARRGGTSVNREKIKRESLNRKNLKRECENRKNTKGGK